jgi:hypothetical protein
MTICNKLTTTAADNHVLAVSRGQEQQRVSSAVQHVNQPLAVSAVCCLDRPESDWTVCIGPRPERAHNITHRTMASAWPEAVVTDMASTKLTADTCEPIEHPIE